MTKILLALDDSDESRAAATGAVQLFGSDADYLAIYVADDPVATSSLVWGGVYGYTLTPTPEIVDELARSSTEALVDAEDDAAELAGAAGVDAEAVGAVGDPGDAIVRAAAEHSVEAIVVGHHQRGWFRSLFDPSVSDDVLAHATVPVVVIPS